MPRRAALPALGLALALASAARAAAPELPSVDARAVRNAVLAQDGVLYIGGDFKRVGAERRWGLAAIELASGRLLPWAPRLEQGSCSALAWRDGLIYAGGGFRQAQGRAQAYLAAFSDARSGEARLAEGWAPRLDSPVADVLPGPGGSLFVAGRFGAASGQPRAGLARLRDARSGAGEPLAFSADFDRRVCSLALDPAQPGVLLAGGHFQRVAGQERALLARLDAESGALLPGSLRVQGGRGQEILRLLVHRGTLYVAGVEIDAVQGQPRRNAFALDPRDFSPRPFRADLDAGAGALSAEGSRILIGGDFKSVNGQPRRAALLDALSGEVLAFDPRPDHNTYAALLLPGLCVLSGYWEHLGGRPAGHLAALDPGAAGDEELRLAYSDGLR